MPPMTARTDDVPPYRKSVGLCVLNPRGLVLMAERSDRAGAWQMPQGGLNIGEEPEVAVLREMKEELGTNAATIIGRVPEPLRYEFPDFIVAERAPFGGKYRGQEQTWFAVLFNGPDSDIRLINEHEPEHAEFTAWRWVPLAEVPDLTAPFRRPIYARVTAFFAPLASSLAQTAGHCA